MPDKRSAGERYAERAAKKLRQLRHAHPAADFMLRQDARHLVRYARSDGGYRHAHQHVRCGDGVHVLRGEQREDQGGGQQGCMSGQDDRGIAEPVDPSADPGGEQRRQYRPGENQEPGEGGALPVQANDHERHEKQGGKMKHVSHKSHHRQVHIWPVAQQRGLQERLVDPVNPDPKGGQRQQPERQSPPRMQRQKEQQSGDADADEEGAPSVELNAGIRLLGQIAVKYRNRQQHQGRHDE